MIPIILAGFVLVSGYLAGIAAGISGTATHMLISLTGISAVLSSEQHGLTGHPYTGFASVRNELESAGMTPRPELLKKINRTFPGNYYDAKLLNSAIAATRTTETCGSELVYHPGNDQGLVDYIRGAFALFGPTTYSLYSFYFVLLGISIAAYLAAFWRSYRACALLFACMCALYPFLADYIHSDQELITVATPRFLSTLGMVPLLHVAMEIVIGRNRLTWPALIGLIVQAAMMAFAIVIRSSTTWMVIGLGVLVLLYVARPAWAALRSQRPEKLAPFFAGRGAVVMVFAATLMAFGAFHDHFLTGSCNTALNAHTIWHNIFYGLRFHPDWERRFGAYYDHQEGDELSFTAAKKYVQAHRLPYQTEPTIWVGPPGGGDDGVSVAMPLGSWKVYDGIMRKAFFEFFRRHPRFVIEDFFYYKPLRFVASMRDYFERAWHDVAGPRLAILLLMAITIGAFAPARSGSEVDARCGFGPMLALTLGALVFSLIPIFLAYGLSFLIIDPAFLIVVAVLLAAIWPVAAVAGSRAHRPEQPKMAAVPPPPVAAEGSKAAITAPTAPSHQNDTKDSADMSRIDQLDIIVRHQDGQAVASLPHISLCAKADTAAAAIELLEQKKRKLLDQLATAGLTDDDVSVSTATPLPGSPRSLMREIGVFAVKSAILIAFFAILVSFAADEADSVLQQAGQDLQARAEAVMQRASGLSGRQFWTKVEANLDRLANSASDLPEEKKKKLLSDIRIIVQRWRPFVAETMGILAAEPKAPATPDSAIQTNK